MRDASKASAITIVSGSIRTTHLQHGREYKEYRSWAAETTQSSPTIEQHVSRYRPRRQRRCASIEHNDAAHRSE